MRGFYSADPAKSLQSNIDNGLREEVERYWEEKGFPLPAFITKDTRKFAFLARHVATGNRESEVFGKTAALMGFVPNWTEFKNDKYTTASIPKTALLKLQTKSGKQRIANPVLWEGRKLSEIKTDNGVCLMEYHHNLWDQMQTGYKKIRCDWGSWLQQFGKARDYYFAEMTIYLAHGVLFKDFHESNKKMCSQKSGEFTEIIVEPAFQKVIEVFGTKPVVHKFSYQEGFEIFQNV